MSLLPNLGSCAQHFQKPKLKSSRVWSKERCIDGEGAHREDGTLSNALDPSRSLDEVKGFQGSGEQVCRSNWSPDSKPPPLSGSTGGTVPLPSSYQALLELFRPASPQPASPVLLCFACGSHSNGSCLVCPSSFCLLTEPGPSLHGPA